MDQWPKKVEAKFFAQLFVDEPCHQFESCYGLVDARQSEAEGA